MNIDPLEEYFEDPDKRAKLYLLMTGAMILTTILITIGTIIFILWAVGVIKM
ncbi:MAG: hypothetical protein HZC47_03390 [Methanobacterium sp.]|uniref:hypothetical protein n=1 Tax=Methanobacterium sp. TaxID=2164 RepID=UPI003D64A3AA|nr:hypothetical protein [Methanobacterium sp.]